MARRRGTSAALTWLQVAAFLWLGCCSIADASKGSPGSSTSSTTSPTKAPSSSGGSGSPGGSTTSSPTKAPTSATTTAPTASTSGTTGSPSTAPTSGGSSGTSSKWDPLAFPADIGGKCQQPANGVPVTVNNYPSSPWAITPFQKTFKPLQKLPPKGKACKDGLCMDAWDIEIKEFMADLNLDGTPCAGASVPTLGYNGISPGPLMAGQMGTQSLVRFTNHVSPTSKWYPPAGPGNVNHGTKDICRDRATIVPGATKGTGRGFVIHHHGFASVSSMDGWADQYFCFNETKDYVLPNNRHTTTYYHDHAVGTTSENVYAGLLGMRLTLPCDGDDPYKVVDVQQTELLIGDLVLAKDCHRLYDRLGVHQNQLWGDINTVNGIPWPVHSLAAKHHRFRFLNGATSRPFFLSFRDDNGVEIGSKVCKIIGGDGGIVPEPIPLPADGLLTDIAYRWDVVCDFTGYEHKTLYLYNEFGGDRMAGETPYFCYSHLMMKINIGAAEPNAPVPNIVGPNAHTDLEQNAALPPALLATLTNRALAGETDRVLEFARSSGMWTLNNRGWDLNNDPNKPEHIEFDNVGQNNVELWTLKAGGGWIHPVHIHLIDFFCVAVKYRNGFGTGGFEPCPPYLLNTPKDVMHIGANMAEITLASRFGPHIGEYMMHCHNVVHEDHDMLAAYLVVDATKGLVFQSMQEKIDFNLLADTPFAKTDTLGDSQNTTYKWPDTPMLGTAYLTQLLDRKYYNIFYPPATLPDGKANPLSDPAQNIWQTTCGIGGSPNGF